jgi:hypothetical protein
LGRGTIAIVVGALLALAFVGGAVRARAAGSPARAPSLEAYGGLGAWVSIYDESAWRAPEQTVGRLAWHDVHTLFLETSNYRQAVDVVRPAAVARFVAAAHGAGMGIVGWYLPSLASPARDLRRALAAASFETTSGDGFDSFALDVEATLVRPVRRRNARAAALAGALRRALGPAYPLAAITIAPVGASPSYWPDYPFAALARRVDVLLPMAYFTDRVRGAARVRAFTAANVRVIRDAVGDTAFPVHAIGGTAPRATSAEIRAFLEAASGCQAVGASLWEAGALTSGEWAALAPANDLAGSRAATGTC